MPDQETTISYLEKQIPAVSGAAVTMAYWKTLNSGGSVLETDGGAIYEVFPDGIRRFVKQIEPPIPVEYGQRIVIPDPYRTNESEQDNP